MPIAPTQVWFMDCMSDQLSNGKMFRASNVVDDYNCESSVIEVDTSLPSALVIRALNQMIERRGN